MHGLLHALGQGHLAGHGGLGQGLGMAHAQMGGVVARGDLQRLGELALRCDGNVLSSPMTYNLSDGLQLIRQGRDLIFYISRARTAMPKSTQDFINRCATYLATGRAPLVTSTLPA